MRDVCFTDLVEDGQVLTLQSLGFVGKAWRTDRKTDRQLTIATALMEEVLGASFDIFILL